MKKIGLVLVVLLNSLLVFGNESISVGILNGPSSIPVAYMMENISKIDGADVSYEKFATPQTLLPKLIKKEINIGFLPVNIAAKVYNSSNGALILCGVSGYGNLHLLTKDKSVKKLSDLAGKKIYVSGKGATPEYLMSYILEKNNVEDVELNFSIPTNQLSAELISNKIQYAVMPEPFVTIAKSNSKEINAPIDLQDEYAKISEEDDFPFTVIVATKDFVENHNELVEEFLDEFENSYEWTIENPKAAGTLCGKFDIFPAPIATKAIPNSNFCFENADDCKDSTEEFLQLFLNYAPESIGGKLPDNGFYFSEAE